MCRSRGSVHFPLSFETTIYLGLTKWQKSETRRKQTKAKGQNHLAIEFGREWLAVWKHHLLEYFSRKNSNTTT